MNREQQERAKLLAQATSDFPTFCRSLVWILDKHAQRTTLSFNEIQRKYNRRRTWRDVILKPRQIGFSTLEIARDVFTFLQPGKRVLMICQTDAENTYVKKFGADVERIIEGLEAAGLDLHFRERSQGRWSLYDRDSSLQIIASGASEAAAAKKGRGGTLSRVHSTECAFYEHPELTMNALLESVPLNPGTEVVFESTPNGMNNYFYNLFIGADAGRNEYRSHFFGWFENPEYQLPLIGNERMEPESERERELVDVYRVTPEQLKWWRAKVSLKGVDEVDQEYPTDKVRAFLKSGRSFFDIGRIENMGTQTKDAIESNHATGLRVWLHPRNWSRYVIGVDPAEGLGEDGDWSVASVWDRDTAQHVATLQNKLQPNPFGDLVDKLGRDYNDAEIIVERNKGMALLSALERLKYPHIFYESEHKPGLATTEFSRVAMLEDLANAVRDGSLTTPDLAAIAELRGFVIDPKSGRPYSPTKKRKNGIGDDFIFSAALAWRLLLTPSVTAGGGVADPRNGVEEDDDWTRGRGF